MEESLKVSLSMWQVPVHFKFLASRRYLLVILLERVLNLVVFKFFPSKLFCNIDF